MTENDPIVMEADGNPEETRNETRTPRGIRFSDSEWERVKRAAAKQDIPAAEFVRNAALGLAEGKTDGDSVALTPGHIALIERTYRCAYILSERRRRDRSGFPRLPERRRTGFVNRYRLPGWRN